MDLHGKTVLITRPATPSNALREELERAGATVIEAPAIAIEPFAESAALTESISRLPGYDWILFTSANAVEHFMRHIPETAALTLPPVAVVGPATAKKLAEWNLAPALLPADYRAEGLLDVFPAGLAGVRILFPRAETARASLPEELRRRGAVVDVIPVYRTVAAPRLEDMRARLQSGAIQCIVFMSPSSIRFMAEAVGDDFAALLSGVSVAVIGPVTGRAAAELGLERVIMPERSTAADLVDALLRG